MFFWSRDGEVWVPFVEDEDISAARWVKFDSNTKIIPNDFFSGLELLERVDGESITEIGSGVFSNCTSLKEVNFPQLKSLGAFSFCGCNHLKRIDLGSTPCVPEKAFDYCSRLSEAIGPRVTCVDAAAFKECRNLVVVSFPRVETVGKEAFLSCSSLKTLDFPELTAVGDQAFDCCFDLKVALVPKLLCTAQASFHGCESLRELVLPSLEEIGAYSFQRCGALQTIDFPVATKIWLESFADCPLLTSVAFPAVTELMPDAFCRLDTASFPMLKSLESVTFSSTQTTLRVVYLPLLETLSRGRLPGEAADGAWAHPVVPWPTKFPALASLPDSFAPTRSEVDAFTGGRPLVLLFASGRLKCYNKPVISGNPRLAELSLGLDPSGFRRAAAAVALLIKRLFRGQVPGPVMTIIFDFIKPHYGIPSLTRPKLAAAGFELLAPEPDARLTAKSGAPPSPGRRS